MDSRGYLPEDWHWSARWAVTLCAGLGLILILRLIASVAGLDEQIARYVSLVAGGMLAAVLLAAPNASHEQIERDYARLDEDPLPKWLVEEAEKHPRPPDADDLN